MLGFFVRYQKNNFIPVVADSYNGANKNAIRVVLIYHFWDMLTSLDSQSILDVDATTMAEFAKSTWPSSFERFIKKNMPA